MSRSTDPPAASSLMEDDDVEINRENGIYRLGHKWLFA
jgi:hypothetical protein